MPYNTVQTVHISYPSNFSNLMYVSSPSYGLKSTQDLRRYISKAWKMAPLAFRSEILNKSYLSMILE